MEVDIIVEDKTAFDSKVQSMITEGWKPKGEMDIIQQNDYTYYRQTMTKK